MSFLIVNGVPLAAADGSASESTREIGRTDQAFDGTLRKTRQTTKRDLQIETPPMASADALAWDGMIRGLPDVWDFESNLYSAKGTGPSSGTASIGATVTHFGAGRAEITTFLQYPVSFPSTWTLSMWRISQDGASYDHYVIYSNGSVYKNNVASVPVGWCSISSSILGFAAPGYFAAAWATGAAKVIGNIVKPTVFNDRYYIATTNGTTHATTEPTWPTTINTTVVDGTVTWRCEGLYKLYLDEVVFFPFEIPTSWVPSLYAATLAFGNSPELTVTGSVVNDVSARTCLGDVGEARLIQASGLSTMRTLSVTLSQK